MSQVPGEEIIIAEYGGTAVGNERGNFFRIFVLHPLCSIRLSFLPEFSFHIRC